MSHRDYSIGLPCDRFVSVYKGRCLCGSCNDNVKLVISEDDVDPMPTITNNASNKAVTGSKETSDLAYECSAFSVPGLTEEQKDHIIKELIQVIHDLADIVVGNDKPTKLEIRG